MIESLSNTTEGVAVSGKKATIKLQLVKDLNYDVVFWAQAEECKAYTFYWENATMTVDYKGLANDDYRDAFYAVRQDLMVTDGLLEETVYLYRPFAQINFGAADYDSVVEYYDQVSVWHNPRVPDKVCRLLLQVRRNKPGLPAYLQIQCLYW